jgi:hypothetical protein
VADKNLTQLKLEHPTWYEVTECEAPGLLLAPVVHPTTTQPIAYDLTGHYAARHTSVKLSNTLTLQLCYENDQKDGDPGTSKRIIFHWSAGNYNQCWDGYQFGVVYDAKTGQAYAVRFLKGNQKGKHLWARNTGSIGISFMAMASGQPVTKAQLMVGARLAAEYCAWHRIDPRATETIDQMACDQPNANSIWKTGKMIQMKVVSDHASYAQQDGYGRFRVDVGTGNMNGIMTELLRIYDALKAGHEKFMMLDIIKG